MEGQPKVVVGLWSLLGAVLATTALLGGLVLILIDNVRDDISGIRLDVASLQSKVDATISDVNFRDSEVRQRLSDLIPQLVLSGERLEVAVSTVEGLSSSVEVIGNDLDALRETLARSDGRQVLFETWVVSQLASTPQAEPRLPADWITATEVIKRSLEQEQNPLPIWDQLRQSFK
jgi:outer membrane murein-binding lipoprotein Lpp